MKFHASIFCLLVSLDFPFFVSCAENYEDKPNFETDGWKQEFEDFKTGLEIKNEECKLVDLTLENESSSESRGFLSDDVKFYLYTKKNAITPQRLGINDGSLQASNYDADETTFFITHGWKTNRNSKSCTLIRDAYLRNTNSNVIVVDWSSISYALYSWSAHRVQSVGKKVAEMIKYLQSAGYLTFARTTLIGHSLGAHVMGIAGYHTQGQIQEIIGLDPALPLFARASPGERISNQDAEYVQIIHTNAGFLGINEVLGHADIFVNGGAKQPGCNPLSNCSHTRAYRIFAESINKRRSFLARECKSIPIMVNNCLGTKIARVGGISPSIKQNGIFYLKTNGEPPYEIQDPTLTFLANNPQ